MKINYMIIILFFFLLVLGLNAVNALDTNLSNCYLNYSVDDDSINNYNFKSVNIEENINTSYNTRANLDNVYVNYTGGNDSNNGTNWNNPLKTIEKALNLVNDRGNIYLAKGTILRNSSNQILINKNVNIIGQNQKETIIDGKGIERLFYITSGNVKFINISLINGFNFMETNRGGGAILNIADNNNLIFINVSFINNTAQSGGAIYSDSLKSNLNFINCDFINNNAVVSGGALF